MTWRQVLGSIFALIAIALLVLYWIAPFQEGEFLFTGFEEPGGTNFALEGSEANTTMQFYSNMRFPDKRISYKIEKSICTLQKIEDTRRAFQIVANQTDLEFFEVRSNEEITITCDSKNKIEGDLFIAGEGGPTNITRLGEFNVIHTGKILLLKESKCKNPNVGVHELLHVLGFDHSNNPNNIMYPVSKCNQTIGEDTIKLINQIYSVPSLPDLEIEAINASLEGRYLDVEVSIRNNGFKNAEGSTLIIKSQNKTIKTVSINFLEIGFGTQIYLTNIFVRESNVKELEFEIKTNFEELNKNNNKATLEIN